MTKPDEMDQQLRRMAAALDYLEKLSPWATELMAELERTVKEYFPTHASEVSRRGSSLSFRIWGLGMWVRTELQVGPGPSFVPRARLAAYIVTDLEGLEQLRPVGRSLELPTPLADPKEKAAQKTGIARQFLARMLAEVMEANGASDRIPFLAIALDAKVVGSNA